MQVCIPLISYKRYDLVINEDIFKVLIIWAKTSWIEMQNTLYSLLKLIFILVTQFKFHVVFFCNPNQLHCFKDTQNMSWNFRVQPSSWEAILQGCGGTNFTDTNNWIYWVTQYSSWEVSHLVSPFFLLFLAVLRLKEYLYLKWWYVYVLCSLCT